jgi:hypothetical protein
MYLFSLFPVDVTRPPNSQIRDFSIESLLDGLPQGDFLDTNVHPVDPLAYANTWIDDLEAEWLKSEQGKGGRHIKWRYEDFKRLDNSNENMEEEEQEGEETDDDVCPLNVWQQDFMFSDRMSMNWTVAGQLPTEADDDGNETIYFR